MALSEAATSMALVVVAAESGRPASKSSRRLCRWVTRGLGASEDAKAPHGPPDQIISAAAPVPGNRPCPKVSVLSKG